MTEADKIKAVVDYLEAEFPQYVIENQSLPNRKAQQFRIVGEKSIFQVEITDDFLIKQEVSGIGDRLRKFTLAEHLREMPSDTVVVTNRGLQLQYE